MYWMQFYHCSRIRCWMQPRPYNSMQLLCCLEQMVVMHSIQKDCTDHSSLTKDHCFKCPNSVRGNINARHATARKVLDVNAMIVPHWTKHFAGVHATCFIGYIVLANTDQCCVLCGYEVILSAVRWTASRAPCQSSVCCTLPFWNYRAPLLNLTAECLCYL